MIGEKHKLFLFFSFFSEAFAKNCAAAVPASLLPIPKQGLLRF